MLCVKEKSDKNTYLKNLIIMIKRLNKLKDTVHTYTRTLNH